MCTGTIGCLSTVPAHGTLVVFIKIVLPCLRNGWAHSFQIWQLDGYFLDATDAFLELGLLPTNSEAARFRQIHARGRRPHALFCWETLGGDISPPDIVQECMYIPYLGNGLKHCAEIGCVVIGPLTARFTHVMSGVNLHVPVCAPILRSVMPSV